MKQDYMLYEMLIKLYVYSPSQKKALQYGEDLISSVDIEYLNNITKQHLLNDIYIDGNFNIYVYPTLFNTQSLLNQMNTNNHANENNRQCKFDKK